MKVELICPDDRVPKPMDMITTITWQLLDGEYRYRVYVEDTRAFYARHFVALPWSLFKWSLKIGWLDLKGMIRGAPKRSLETVADVQERG